MVQASPAFLFSLWIGVAGRITRRNAPEIATKVLQGAAWRAGIHVIAQHYYQIGTITLYESVTEPI